MNEEEFKKIINKQGAALLAGLVDPYTVAKQVFTDLGLDHVHERSMEFAKFWTEGYIECEDNV